MPKRYLSQRYNKFSMIGLIMLLCFMVGGCDFLWNISTRSGLKEDILLLASQCGVKISNPICNMKNGSREGYCLFTASEQEVAALVNGLKLNEVKSGLTAGDLEKNIDIYKQYDVNFWGLENTLRPFDIFKVADRRNIKAFFVSGRPEQLHLKSHRAFDYLLFYYDNISSRACIFVCYSYG